MSNDLNFSDLSIIELPVQVGENSYTLREANEATAVKWRNATMAAARFRDGSISGFSGIADSEPLLVSLCLFDKDNKNVHIDTVKEWPARIVKTMFEKAKEISELGETEETVKELEDRLQKAKEVEEAAKNDKEGTENS